MKLLKVGDRRVLRIIQNSSVDRQKEYRLSRWVFPFEADGSVILRSSLSKRIYQLDSEEWVAVRKKDNSHPVVEELVRQFNMRLWS